MKHRNENFIMIAKPVYKDIQTHRQLSEETYSEAKYGHSFHQSLRYREARDAAK